MDINALYTLGGEGGGGRSISVECIRGRKERQVLNFLLLGQQWISLQFLLLHYTYDFSVAVHPPSSVEVSFPPPVFIGSSLTLTCYITLGEEDTVEGLTVEVVWTRPDSSSERVTATGSGTSYTSNILLFNLAASDDGPYSCIASLTSSLPFLIGSQNVSNSTTISTGTSDVKLV